MQRRKSNPNLIRLIDDLLITSAQNNSKVWKEIAERLAKPLQSYAEVNLGKIERYGREGEMIIVPGKVLGGGEISKGIDVVAWKFSESAKRKIESAGGRCLTFEDALKENPEGKRVRIIV